MPTEYKHRNRLTSIVNAARGFSHASEGKNFVIHLLTGITVILFAYWLPVTTTELFTIIILITLVLTAELFNTAIEELSDVLIKEHHPGIARVKELSAAAVLTVCIGAAIIGVVIALRYC